MKRILFVDDDPKVLDGLRRLLYPHRAEWQMEFAGSGLEALEVLSKAAFDVVVTDIPMPGMDGTELLAEVRKRHPSAVRVILSGQADRDLTLKSAATAHQYLSKPCDAETLKLTIARASALKDVLSEPSLQSLVTSARSLPSVPSLYTELVRQLESPDCCIKDVANIVARDTAMTAKILQLANSAFFGVRRRVVEPKDAVLYLGLDTVKSLTLTVKVFSQFTASACSRFSVEALANHSVLVGSLARSIAKEAGLSNREIEDAFTAGLLHEVGKLVLVGALPEKYNEALAMAEATRTPLWKAEREIFGTTHAEVGTYLLWLWGMPDPVVEAVAYHLWPGRCPAPQPSPLTAVHIASILSHAVDGARGEAPELDSQYVQLLGLSEKIANWETFVADTTQKQEVV